jgi:GNAT superfamily N-acetyltransferase
MNITLRKASREDVPAMLALVKELANYEKATDEVEVTEKEMVEDGFGKNPAFSAFVAEYEGKVIGVALYYTKYSTWKGRCIYLDDIIVTENYRRKGIGAKLFEMVIEECRNMGARKLDWQVLHWNESAISFYKKYNAFFNDEWINGTLFEKELKNS